MGYDVKERVTSHRIMLVDVTVAGGVLKSHKTSEDVGGSLMAPNVGVPIGSLKLTPMPVFEASEAPNHDDEGGTTYNMCIGCNWRDRTSQNHSKSLAWTAGIKGMRPVQRSAILMCQESMAPPGMAMTRLQIMPKQAVPAALQGAVLGWWDEVDDCVNFSED